MKWVKFEHEFYDGLNRFLKNGNTSNGYKKTQPNAYEPDVVVWKKHDLTIDSCFRVYKGTSKEFKEEYLNKEGTLQEDSEYFHLWLRRERLPKEYFDPTYFGDEYLKEYGLFLEGGKEYYDKIKDLKKLSSEDQEKKSNNENKQDEYKQIAYGNKKYPRPHPYEIYIGGWIQFFDEQVRNGDTDHAVYFDWEIENEAVNVYILQTKLLRGCNVNINVNITKSPTSTDPPPPKPGPPGC